jgi:hypothetical protein
VRHHRLYVAASDLLALPLAIKSGIGTLLILCLHLSHLLSLLLLLPNLRIELVLLALVLHKGPLFLLDALDLKLKRRFREGSGGVVDAAAIIIFLILNCLLH